MKQPVKTIFLALATLFTTATAFAQDEKKDDDHEGHWGFLGGANFASISESGANGITTFYGGVLKDTKIVPFFKFQSGLTYVRNGSEVDGTTVNLDYIQIPALLKIKIGPVYALTGFTGGVKISENFKGDYAEVLNEETRFKSFDFGSQFGVGYKIAMIGIEARYNWGLTSIFKEETAIEYHNRYFQLGLNVMLP